MSYQNQIEMRQIDGLIPYERNARTYSKKQIKQIAASIERWGFTNPVLITSDGRMVAGHGRVQAAKLLGLTEVPTLVLADLSDAERRAYILADNKLAANAGWDSEILAIELQALTDLSFDLEVTGFSLAEVDFVHDGAREADPDRKEDLPEDVIIPLETRAVSQLGDLWQLGRHVLVCGDARDQAAYVAVTGGVPIDLIFADPPYNCAIDGHVCGKGKVKHREFAMASGELSDGQFVEFLRQTLSQAAAACRDGAIAFICMDWRGMEQLLRAGRDAFTQLKQVCVWYKPRGGMGTFYRSQHEFVFAFKKGRPSIRSTSLNSLWYLPAGLRIGSNLWPIVCLCLEKRAEPIAKPRVPSMTGRPSRIG